MINYYQVISSLMLLSLSSIVHASGPDELRRAFQAEQARQIQAQSVSALDSIQAGLLAEINASMHKRFARQRVAFLNQQRRNVLRQGQRALATIKQEACNINNVPILAMGQIVQKKGLWRLLAFTGRVRRQ